MREAGSGTREVIERALTKARPENLQKSSDGLRGSTEAIKRAVAYGPGVAIVSHLTIQTELASGQLAILPLRGFQLTRRCTAHVRRNRGQDPATLAFLALLDQRYGSDVGSEPRSSRIELSRCQH